MNENPILDLNAVYESAERAVKSCPFKYQNQLFEANQLLYSAILEESIEKMEYCLKMGNRFKIKERGKERVVTSNAMQDKAALHLLVDMVLTPALERYLIPSNAASRKGKGTAYFRRQIVKDLQYAYSRYGLDAVITTVDFSGFYASIPQQQCREYFKKLLSHTLDADTCRYADYLIGKCMENFKEELGCSIGIDIGNQFSQSAGTAYPVPVDNYAKIVKGVHCYVRYNDDLYYITRTQDEANEILAGIERAALSLGLKLNRKKTRSCKISEPFKLLQITYWVEGNGRIVRKIQSEAITRERKRLKAYKRLLDAGQMPYSRIEGAYKSWMAQFYRYMSCLQISNMARLYYQLFRRLPKWKKHGRLHWLMEQSLTT